MQKYYYAKEVSSGLYSDSNIYYNDEFAYDDGIYVGGRKHCVELNADLKNETLKKLENIISDFNETGENNSTYYFEGLASEKENEILRLAKYHERYDEDMKILAETLTIVKDEKYENGIIRGYCQDDWLYYVAPEKMAKTIEYIEAVIFNTGIEVAITESKCEASEVDETETYCAYYTCKSDNDLKKAIALDIGCNIDEVKLLKISNTKVVYHYEYKEV